MKTYKTNKQEDDYVMDSLINHIEKTDKRK